MIILGIETSCDETAVAVVESLDNNSHGHIRISRGRRPSECFSHANILSNVVSSQVELHKKYGGVWPTLAKREHQKNLVPVLENALKGANLLERNRGQTRVRPGSDPKRVNPRSRIYLILDSILEREQELLKQLKNFFKKYQKPEIDLIAVTVGPGLEPCLWTGINFAKALSYVWDLPIVPVNHIEAHILANLLLQVRESSKSQIPITKKIPNSNYQNSKQITFPAVCLVVSGGHTQLILMKGLGKYKIIGETRDDAAGECFDKTARILGLGYPGGPAIAATAVKISNVKCLLRTIRVPHQNKFGAGWTPRRLVRGQMSNLSLPRPMINQKNYDFSFSGLKTAVLYEYKKQPPKIQKSKKYIQEMAKEIQQAIIDVLIKKTIKAAKDFRAKTIIVGGGVTANKELREQLAEACLKWNFKHLIPVKDLCTDNAAMVAVVGYYGWLRKKTKKWQKIEAEANLRLE